jgi:hypothetical protein
MIKVAPLSSVYKNPAKDGSRKLRLVCCTYTEHDTAMVDGRTEVEGRGPPEPQPDLVGEEYNSKPHIVASSVSTLHK